MQLKEVLEAFPKKKDDAKCGVFLSTAEKSRHSLQGQSLFRKIRNAERFSNIWKLNISWNNLKNKYWSYRYIILWDSLKHVVNTHNSTKRFRQPISRFDQNFHYFTMKIAVKRNFLLIKYVFKYTCNEVRGKKRPPPYGFSVFFSQKIFKLTLHENSGLFIKMLR